MTPGGKRDKITGLYFVFQIILSLNYLSTILRKYNYFQMLIKNDTILQTDNFSEKINCLLMILSSYEIIKY